MLILCVEDENFLRNDLIEELQLAGYDVDGACDGVEALERIAARPPDIILTDVSMPRMTGHDLLAKIRNEKLCDARILFMTAFDEAEVALRGSLKPDVIIRKPVDYGNLLAMLGGYRIPAVQE